MWVRNLSLAGVLCALGIATAGPTYAQTNVFVLRTCNSTGEPVNVSVASRVSPTDARWVVRGWWIVPPGECGNLARLPKGWIYLYAMSEGKEWAGKDVGLCVEIPGPFERIVDENRKEECAEDLYKGYLGVQVVRPDIGVITWTLTDK
jgi:uncharacterized membrane protein